MFPTKWNEDDLLKWIQEKQPNLLEHDDCEKLKTHLRLTPDSGLEPFEVS